MDPQQNKTTNTTASLPADDKQDLFRSPPARTAAVSPAVWAVSGLLIAILLGGLLYVGVGAHKGPAARNTLLPADSYAQNLEITGLQMSESSSLSGLKSTFLDGHLKNNGPATLTGATVQVVFANDETLPPQIETAPLSLVRTRQPYVDTEPLATSPLAAGGERDFRLTFENLGANWNGQLPQLRVIHTSTK